MTEKEQYQWDTMWDVTADPQAMFISALFFVKENELPKLIETDQRAEPERGVRLKEWAEKLNLTENWCVPKALAHLHSFPPAVWVNKFTFEHPAFDGRTTSGEKYIEGIRAAFDKELAAYMARNTSTPDPTLMQPGEKRNPQHFLWAVMYFVERKTIEQIAAQEGVSQQSTDAGVRSVAKMVSLPMKQRGRPKKIAQKNTG